MPFPLEVVATAAHPPVERLSDRALTHMAEFLAREMDFDLPIASSKTSAWYLDQIGAELYAPATGARLRLLTIQACDRHLRTQPLPGPMLARATRIDRDRNRVQMGFACPPRYGSLNTLGKSLLGLVSVGALAFALLRGLL